MSANPRGVYALPPRVRNFNRHRAKLKRAWARFDDVVRYKAQAKARNSPEMERLAVHNLESLFQLIKEIGTENIVIGYEPEVT